MHDFIPTSPIAQLDVLFDLICVKLQLSSTAYNLAESRYKSVSAWLNDKNSSLVGYKPYIYPQGSLNLGTTTKPVGKAEYDLDFVCEFQAIKSENCLNPLLLLDLIEERLCENETYKKMYERLNRCIRLSYANDFHLDILPACPNPSSELFGKTCVLVPDSKARDWKHSNPLGFADWFRFKAREAAVSFAEKSVKPLPQQQAYMDLAALQKVVQMMKRNRDIKLAKLPEKERPISVVLTTLAARFYHGNPSPTVALLQVLEAIISAIADEPGERLIVLNPTNENEDLSERWENQPELYQTFVDWIHGFRQDLQDLTEVRGLHNVEAKLKEMFGENLTKGVMAEFAEQIDIKRRNGSLAVAKGTGLIVPATVAHSTTVKPNTFHGRE
jgi:hypothetical protein